MITTLAQQANEQVQYAEKGWWMPQQASTFAGELDWVFFFIYWVSIFFFVLIGVAMFLFAFLYRQRDKKAVAHGAHHNNALEITWSVLPLIILLAIFIWGFKGFLDMTTPPGEAYEIQVQARKWSWQFTYPEGVVSNELHIPADTPVRLILNSTDVLHSLFVPAFRFKKDVVPGRYNNMWVEAPWIPSRATQDITYKLPEGEETDKVAVYDLYCTEYCGTQHSKMLSSAFVHTPDGFNKWIMSENAPDERPEVYGEKLYQTQGCASCHSTSGAPLIGPSFRDLWGRQENIEGGSPVLVDEQYVRDSILNPGKQIVAGYPPQMPAYPFNDAQLNAIFAYLKSISKHYKGNLASIRKEHGGPPIEGTPVDNVDSQQRGENTLPPSTQQPADQAQQVPSAGAQDNAAQPAN